MENLRKLNDVAKLNDIDDQVDLGALFLIVWRGKITVAIAVVVCGLLSIIYSYSQPMIYRAEVLLVPALEEKQNGLSALANQYGGLASLAGVNLGAGGASVEQTLAILKSRSFTQNFIAKHDLLVPLFAFKKKWILSSKYILDDERYNEKSRTWNVNKSSGESKKPTRWQAFRAFSRIISVGKLDKNGLLRIGIEWINPVEAKQWVDWLIEDLNEKIKNDEVQDAEKSILYLTDNLHKTSVVELHEIFYSLIENQTKTIMLAKIRDEYALKTIDPAVVPDSRIKPNRRLLAIMGLLVGGIVGLAIVLVRNSKLDTPGIRKDINSKLF